MHKTETNNNHSYYKCSAWEMMQLSNELANLPFSSLVAKQAIPLPLRAEEASSSWCWTNPVQTIISTRRFGVNQEKESTQTSNNKGNTNKKHKDATPHQQNTAIVTYD